jgi:hypothetical protein
MIRTSWRKSRDTCRYLTRSEAKEAREHMNLRLNRADTWDIKDKEQVSLDFLQEVRIMVDNWVDGYQDLVRM